MKRYLEKKCEDPKEAWAIYDLVEKTINQLSELKKLYQTATPNISAKEAEYIKEKNKFTRRQIFAKS